MKDLDTYIKMFEKAEWDHTTLQAAYDILNKINDENFKLPIYPNQFEIVTAEQLMDAMSMIGLPVSYGHWSFGKNFVSSSNGYKKGKVGLSYEMIINSDPCISYNLEDNTTCLMVLVMAHAAFGHNNFFKENYLFKYWTQADAIIDYMSFARNYVKQCEDRYGEEAVEEILDACHALMSYGIDKYKRPSPLSVKNEMSRRAKILLDDDASTNELWHSLVPKGNKTDEEEKFPSEPQENILYFIEKNSPCLKNWQKELVRIVRKVAQYFYPQSQTKVSNEGWASFCHYNFVHKMRELGYLGDGFMLEFLSHHSSVVLQPSFDKSYYRGLNPYALGFNIYQDIRRICENPTDEDREWFPNLVGKDWKQETYFAMQNFKDDSFIQQYLSPKVIRDMKLFMVEDGESEYHYEVSRIHNDRGYKDIRESLASWYNRNRYVPDIQIDKVDVYGDRTLSLVYTPFMEMKLEKKESEKTLKYIKKLWGFNVSLFDEKGKVLAYA